MDMEKNNYCIILAGGKGRRLWPYSRGKYPKQFIDFFGTGRTQLQAVFDLFSKILPQDNIYVSTNQDYKNIVMEQLPDLSEQHITVEEVSRNTAPSVAWTNLCINQHNEDANVIVVPSDLFVLNEEAFRNDVISGLKVVAEHDIILAMGVKPTRPEPGYGYIQIGDATDTEDIYKVKSFTEKPERDFAQMFVDSGEFLWNTGMFLANSYYLRSYFHQLFPEVQGLLAREYPDASIEEELQFIRGNYGSYPNLSIDYGVLEHSENVFLQRCDFGWADLGTWHSLYECRKKSDGDNVVVDSEVIMEDCHNNVIKLPKGKLAVINGLDGYIVAEKGNVLLVCKKGDSSALIRKYVNEIQMKYGEDFT